MHVHREINIWVFIPNGTWLKLKPHILVPYRVLKIKPNGRYDVEKEANIEG